MNEDNGQSITLISELLEGANVNLLVHVFFYHFLS